MIPFLENVLRGRNVPRERMLAVAEHYQHFGGVSPINAQNRALIAALEQELNTHGPHLPVYWGNRNWRPLLPEALAKMRADGVRRAMAFFTSAYSSYSGCRQYRENIERARAEIGEGAPVVDKLRVFYNNPGFIEPMVENVRAALGEQDAAVVYTAHSIPLAMAESSAYVQQLRETTRLISAALGRHGDPLVYQSRSGAPGQPWLEPDIGDWLREHRPPRVVIVPVGFISDHMEVLYDLDTEAREICEELGLHMVRAATVGTHPRFIRMIRELMVERIADPARDACAADCCPGPRRG